MNVKRNQKFNVQDTWQTLIDKKNKSDLSTLNKQYKIYRNSYFSTINCKKLIIVSGVCFSSMFVVSWCVFCSISLLFGLHVHAFAFKSMIHCGSAFEPGASGLPYYSTPTVCVPAVIGALAVWWQNKTKEWSCFLITWPTSSCCGLVLWWWCRSVVR